MNKVKKITVSNNIRKLRFFKDEMTQQDLSELTGVSRQTINAIEQGKYLPSLELAFRIADVFEVDINEVFSYKLESN
jgi:putative transcriptional regulator